MIKIIIFIFVALCLTIVSFILPFLLIDMYKFLIESFDIDYTLFPLSNYIQIVTATMSFLFATLLSCLVYHSTIKKDMASRKQDANEICSYLDDAFNQIESEANGVPGLNINIDSIPYRKIVYSLKLNEKERKALQAAIAEISKIGASANGSGNTRNLCSAFLKSDNFTACKSAVERIKRLYLKG